MFSECFVLDENTPQGGEGGREPTRLRESKLLPHIVRIQVASMEKSTKKTWQCRTKDFPGGEATAQATRV